MSRHIGVENHIMPRHVTPEVIGNLFILYRLRHWLNILSLVSLVKLEVEGSYNQYSIDLHVRSGVTVSTAMITARTM